MLVVDAVITFTAWLPRSISLVYAELNNDKDYKLSCRYDKLVNSNADNFKFMIAHIVQFDFDKLAESTLFWVTNTASG